MALKKLIGIFLFMAFSASFATAQQQTTNPDSVIHQVFNALTADAVYISKKADFTNVEWEALAYWDTKDPKQLEYMHEAVGDIYQFQAKSYAIKAIDPDNPAAYLPTLTGSLVRTKNTLTLSSARGSTLVLEMIFLDEHYLILEMEGLRIFFTKSRSFQGR